MLGDPISRRPMAMLLLGHDLLMYWVFANLTCWLVTGQLSDNLMIEWGAHAFSLTIIFSFYIFDLFRPKIERRVVTVLFEMFAALVCANILFFLVRWTFYSSIGVAPRTFIWSQHLLTLFIFLIWATAVRGVLASVFRRERRKIKWLIVGTNECLQILWADLKRIPFPGRLVCLVDSRSSQTSDGSASSVSAVGTWADLDQYLKEQWTGVVYAGGQGLPDSIAQTLMKARLQGQSVIDLADFYEQIWNKVPVFYLKNQWFVLSQGFQLLHDPFGLKVKRVLDIIIASSLLIPALPLMLFGALLIRFESAGPIIFRQVRSGEGGRPFTIFKFRTMVQDAEKNGAQWAQKNDARITRIGKMLRLTRIDELPQLFNVIRGDMSFVGPRPERPEFDETLEAQIPFYNLRHLLKPGITGWAQVNYQYGASVDDAREKLQYDLFYLKNYSFWLDFQVVLRTIRVVLAAAGR